MSYDFQADKKMDNRSIVLIYLTAIELCNKNSGTLYTSCNASMLHKQTALLLS